MAISICRKISCLLPPTLLDQNPVDASSNYGNSRQNNAGNHRTFYSKGTTLGGLATTSDGDKKEVIL